MSATLQSSAMIFSVHAIIELLWGWDGKSEHWRQSQIAAGEPKQWIYAKDPLISAPPLSNSVHIRHFGCNVVTEDTAELSLFFGTMAGSSPGSQSQGDRNQTEQALTKEKHEIPVLGSWSLPPREFCDSVDCFVPLQPRPTSAATAKPASSCPPCPSGKTCNRKATFLTKEVWRKGENGSSMPAPTHSESSHRADGEAIRTSTAETSTLPAAPTAWPPISSIAQQRAAWALFRPAITAACHTSGLVPVGRAEESGPQGLDHANAEGRMAREGAQKIGIADEHTTTKPPKRCRIMSPLTGYGVKGISIQPSGTQHEGRFQWDSQSAKG
ncbi:uncharacterized protein CLUP02_08548 [Colletotrichum lupini]|uniref:Uncharacterized protein n=1 Tax=Colletotrichum lupini TaxID=145971 RepID=A0A9Q8SUY7_9PEZI|nr:uncharacterized protein CLUP02_08548 [Colletotrichum lupini]UQC83057.1 hypothetical protein CLUP02_08548 [Colletotrichum lupini]